MWKTLWIVYKSPKKRFIFGDKVWIISGLKLASKFKKGYKYWYNSNFDPKFVNVDIHRKNVEKKYKIFLRKCVPAISSGY